MIKYIFSCLFSLWRSSFFIIPFIACAMDPANTQPAAKASGPTPIMEVEIIEIPYPALDSAWREGKRDPGEASPALLKIRLARSAKPRMRGVITQTRESSFAEKPTAEIACGSDAPTLSRGASKILKLFRDSETQTDSEIDLCLTELFRETTAREIQTDPVSLSHQEVQTLSQSHHALTLSDLSSYDLTQGAKTSTCEQETETTEPSHTNEPSKTSIFPIAKNSFILTCSFFAGILLEKLRRKR